MKLHLNKTKIFSSVIFGLISISSIANAQEKSPIDFSGFWTVKFESEPSGKELFKKLPERAVFIDDAGGGELADGDYAGLTLSEKAQQEVKDHDFEAEFSLENTCKQPSVAYYMQAPFPLEIHQTDKILVLKMEYFDMVRLIFLDGREIPDAAPHSKNGYSVGHWEKDELVVRTEKLASATLMNNGFNHSENLTLTERFKMSADGQTLWLTQVYEDPEVFTGLAARYMAWTKQEGEYVYPYECNFSFAQ